MYLLFPIAFRNRHSLKDEDGHNVNHTNQKAPIIEYCNWTGNIADLDKHIKICKYQVITCKYCKDWILQQDMDNHYLICLRYPVQCNQCHIDIPRCFLLNHMNEECKLSKINCQKCNKIIVRQDKECHLKTECSDRLIQCKYYKLGCDEMIKQKELQSHMEQSVDYHLHLLQIAYSTNEVDSKYKQLVRELKHKETESPALFINSLTNKHKLKKLQQSQFSVNFDFKNGVMQDIEFGFDAIDLFNNNE